MPSVSRSKSPCHLGLDIHKDSISVAILHPNDEAVDVERIFHDETSVRRLVDGLNVSPAWWPSRFLGSPESTVPGLLLREAPSGREQPGREQ